MTSPIADRESAGAERARGWVVAVAAVVGIVGLWLLASGLLFVGWTVRDFHRHAENHVVGQAITDRQSVRSAVEMYLAQNPTASCPTVAELVSSRILSAWSRTADPWDNEYEIECVGAEVIVASAGPDGTFRTSDDVR
jgi:hypothetical protein